MKRAFTLIELIVALVILAVLAAIIAPNAFKAIRKAQIARTLQSFKAIKQSALSYYADTGTWIAQYKILDGTGPFFRDPGIAGWDGPYLERYEKSPLVQPSIPNGPEPGWYYVWADNQEYDSTFDLNGDGIYEVNDGISVCCYGFPSVDAYRMDEIVDGTGQWGYSGIMNVVRVWGSSATAPYYCISLLIGQTGVPRGSR